MERRQARVNRIANIVVSLIYVVTVAATLIGESWVYHIVGTLIEIALLLVITRLAWAWPKGTLMNLYYSGGYLLTRSSWRSPRLRGPATATH